MAQTAPSNSSGLQPKENTGLESPAARVLLIAALLLACVYYSWRGPGRAWPHSIDFSAFYGATRAWLEGSDPYDHDNLCRILETRDIRPFNNPPPLFLLMAPIAALPWPAAEKAWTILNVLLTALCLWLIVPMLNMRWREPRTILFLAAALALAPFHTAIKQGQLTLPATALILLGMRFDLKDRRVLAGIFMGLAVSIKPQTILLFVLLPLCRNRWRTTAYAAATAAVTGIIGAGRLLMTHTNWFHTWQSNLAELGRGGHDDPTSPDKSLMVNLQPLLHTFMTDRWLAAILSFGFVVLVGAVILLLLRKRRDPQTEFMLYASVAVLSLLALYNRIYGATLLVLPLAWAVVSLRSAQLRRTAVVALVLILPFLAPGPAALAQWADQGVLPVAADAWWWRNIVLMHQNYALLLLALTMLYAAWRIRKPETGA